VVFEGANPVRSCMGGDVTLLPITASGHAPLRLTYAMQLGDQRREFLVHRH
jgi:hypothetical protein